MTARIDASRTVGDNLPALVVGSGMSAMMAARSLLELGAEVLLVNAGSPESWLYARTPGLDLQEEAALLSDNLDEVEIVRAAEYPRITRHGAAFEADLGAAGKRRCGCVILAPGNLTAQLPPGLPEGTGMIAPRREWHCGQAVAFVLDYGPWSSPAMGMAAIRHALDIQLEDGIAYVLMRHVPVASPGGELLYDEAKRAGVQFFRFGDRLPEVRTVEKTNGKSKGKKEVEEGIFSVRLTDLIDADRAVELECDAVVAAPVIRPSAALRGLFEVTGDPDADGFLLPESVHCHSGQTFRGGVFAIGEVTGEFDLLRVKEQSAAAALNARAWMLSATEREQASTVSVGDSCIRCLTCGRICPHSAISFDPGPARSQIRVSSALCRQCGICVSECPRGVLDMRSYPEPAFDAVLESLSLKWGYEPIVVYGCERSAGRAWKQITLPSDVWFFSVPCAGRVSESMLLRTLAAGTRGVMVVGCHGGNCASSTGTEWSKARVEATVGGMQGVSLPVEYRSLSSHEPARLLRIVNEFSESLAVGSEHSALSS
ncbi:MAG: hydrogenase iron-sulfur subunit [Thermodesulfobacteriota bacterium]